MKADNNCETINLIKVYRLTAESKVLTCWIVMDVEKSVVRRCVCSIVRQV